MVGPCGKKLENPLFNLLFPFSINSSFFATLVTPPGLPLFFLNETWQKRKFSSLLPTSILPKCSISLLLLETSLSSRLVKLGTSQLSLTLPFLLPLDPGILQILQLLLLVFLKSTAFFVLLQKPSSCYGSLLPGLLSSHH